MIRGSQSDREILSSVLRTYCFWRPPIFSGAWNPSPPPETRGDSERRGMATVLCKVTGGYQVTGDAPYLGKEQCSIGSESTALVPKAAATNHHGLGGLNRQKCILSASHGSNLLLVLSSARSLLIVAVSTAFPSPISFIIFFPYRISGFFPFFFFNDFQLFVKLLICSCIIFLISLNFLSVFFFL